MGKPVKKPATPINTNNFPRADYATKEPWNPNKFRANCCGSLIFSARPGLFVRCHCGKAFIDQTREYSRCSGNITLIEQDKE